MPSNHLERSVLVLNPPSVCSPRSHKIRNTQSHVFAAQAIWRIGPKGQAAAASVVPSLIDQFATSKDARLRAWVAEILCEIGPDAQAAIPVLRTAAADPDVQVRRAVGNALRAIRGVETESQSGEQRPTRNP